MGSLFGGRKDNRAAEESQKNRELQRISNERQLSAQQAETTRSSPSRRKPRGRRLFSTDDTKTSLS